jgi:tetrapyrrole methylase family protein/MazG family protein
VGKIVIVGLGAGDRDSLTMGALDVLKTDKRIILHSGRLPVAAALITRGIGFETLDDLYRDSEDFDTLAENGALRVMEAVEDGDVVYGALGSGVYGDGVAERLLEVARRRDIPVGIVAGVDSLAGAGALAGCSGAYRVMNAMDVKDAILDGRETLFVRELDNPLLAGDVKVKLLETYPAGHRIAYGSGYQLRLIALEDLDRQKDLDHTAHIGVPKLSEGERQRYDFYDLVAIIAKLRAPGGCPWDREQTHESLKPCMIEECYEALDAIDRKDDMKLADELGDVLLQAVFHAEIGREREGFDIGDVTTAVCKKMIERHPHIFGSVTAETADAVLKNWEEIKKTSYGHRTHSEVIESVPKNLPALMYAYKVQKKAAQAGFDWQDVEGAFPKIEEELSEVAELLPEAAKHRDRLTEELGDLLFAVVNVFRKLKIEPELALDGAVAKFISRFEAVEKAVLADGKAMEACSLEELDGYWDKIKEFEH